jgi:hypothetical protein
MKDVYTNQYKRHLYNYKVVSFWISVANEGEKRSRVGSLQFIKRNQNSKYGIGIK